MKTQGTTKVCVDLDPILYERVQDLARITGITIRSIVESGLDREIERLIAAEEDDTLRLALQHIDRYRQRVRGPS